MNHCLFINKTVHELQIFVHQLLILCTKLCTNFILVHGTCDMATAYFPYWAKGPSTNRFRPPIADLFRDGGRGLAFESAFKKKIRTKPQLVFIKHRQYNFILYARVAPTNCTDFKFKFVAFSQEVYDFFRKGTLYFLILPHAL